MQAQATPQLPVATPVELRARFILVEEGSSPHALSVDEDKAGTTVVVPLTGEGPWENHRIERRFAELAQAGLTVTDVVFALAGRTGELACARRLAALRTVAHCAQGRRTDIVLVLPARCSAELRSEIFTLTEFLTTQRGSRARIRICHAQEPDRSRSGFLSEAQSIEALRRSRAQEGAGCRALAAPARARRRKTCVTGRRSAARTRGELNGARPR